MPLDVHLGSLPSLLHRFGGLSPGNLASQAHAGERSFPRAGAQQCLQLLITVAELGQPTVFLPPLLRPDADLLAQCGFAGARALADALAAAPDLAAIACAGAALWTANAATVAPAADQTCVDAPAVTRVLIANLAALPHRSREASAREAQLRQLLAPAGLAVLPALPAHPAFGDEGAANHLRLAADGCAVHIFVHGTAPALAPTALPQRHPARQTLLASQLAARRLCLPQAVHVRQHPAAIDAGAFHHDVVGVSQGDVLLLHARAFVDQEAVLAGLRVRLPSLHAVVIADAELPLDEAVRCYLFNSLLVPTPRGLVLVAPEHCRTGRAQGVIDRLRAEGVIADVRFCPLDQSMRGGGGPACLRLRLPLTAQERAGLAPQFRLTPARCRALAVWIDRWYPESLDLADLADPALPTHVAAAHAALAGLMETW